MPGFRFTLFNSITLFVAALTALTAWRADDNWRLACYAVLLGFTFGFPYSLHPVPVLLGAALALAARFGWGGRAVRWAQYPVHAYVLWRCLALLMMW